MPKNNQKEELGFGLTCRGTGTIFIEVTGVPEGLASWRVLAHTPRGASPAEIVETTKGSHVLTLPVMSVSQQVMVYALDDAGRIIGSAKHVVRPVVAKLVSTKNTFAHKKQAQFLRTCNKLRKDNRVFFGDYRAVLIDDGVDALQATLYLQGSDESLAEVEVSFVGLLQNGEVLGGDRVSVLGDVTRPREDCAGAFTRTIRYSFHLSSNEKELCLWARFPKGDFESTFYAIDPFELRDLRLEYVTSSIPVEEAHNYEGWFLQQRANEAVLTAQRAEQETFALRPLFSVVVPLYHTPVRFFRDVMEGLLNQSYPQLEVILVNSTPNDEELREWVSRYELRDERVRVVTLEHNLGITENTNAGIAVAKGDFVCFMDHDDTIELDLFYWYAKEVNEHPQTDLLYCDEDLLVKWWYSHPFFKPDWSMAFLESNNYVCHLLTVRKALLADLPEPTSELDGAQDHSMTLFVGERAREVRHVRKVLYHWRVHEKSTAQNADEKPESYLAGKRAIDNHFERIGFLGRCTSIERMPHCYETNLTNVERPSASVVLWGEGGTSADLAERCGLELVEARREAGETWSQAVARAFGQVSTDLVMVLSRGATLPTARAFDTLCAYAQREDMGVVAPRIVYPDGSLMSLGVAFSLTGETIHMGRSMSSFTMNGRGYAWLSHDATAVEPTCFVVSRALLEACRWDASLGMEAATADLCLGVRAQGKPVVVVPTDSVTVRMDDAELGTESQAQRSVRVIDHARLMQKWPQIVGVDPYYHTSLSEDGRFSFEGAWHWFVPMGTKEKLSYKLTY